MESPQTTGDWPMLTALNLLTDNRKKFAILAMLSFMALC